MIEIQKNIIMVPKTPKHEFPFSEMEVGDSFAVPYSTKMVSVLRSYACRFGQMNGKTFSVRVIKDEDVIRAWRTQ